MGLILSFLRQTDGFTLVLCSAFGCEGGWK